MQPPKPPRDRAARLLGAMAGGAVLGLAELGVVLAEGRLVVEDPLIRAGAAAALSAAVGAPGALLGRGAVGGVWGAALIWSLAEVGLAVMTDPPPFQAAPWWVGNPLVVLAALAAAGALGGLAARWPGLRVGSVLALVWPLARFGPAVAPSAQAPVGAPDVVVVTLDTTRADRTSPWGHELGHTPNLAKLAEGGVLFEAAFAPIAVTGPSHTSLWSGQGTWSHGVLLNGVPVPGDLPLLAERMRAEGWEGAAFVSAYVLEQKVGLDRGFSVYDDDLTQRGGLDTLLPARLWATLGRWRDPDLVLERRGDHTVDRALAWLERRDRSRPALVWVHLFDPHGPYTPPEGFASGLYTGGPQAPTPGAAAPWVQLPAYLRASLEGVTNPDWVKAQYDGEIHFADAQLGRLLEALETEGRPTLVVVAGDHGESLGEHGVWFNHGDDLFDASLHVPLLMRYTGVLPAGVRVPEVVELVDVAPTVLELLGLPALEGADGVSLAPLWQQLREPGRSARALAFDRPANQAAREAGQITAPTFRLASVRTPRSRYVLREAEGWDDALYVALEPGEGLCPLGEADQLPALRAEPGGEGVVHALEAASEVLLNAGGGVERSGVTLGDEERRRLDALGYLEQ